MERWQKPEAENAPGRLCDHQPTTRSSLDYNTPLRSARRDATSAPSPFYKLSAELSRESLRIPGAVPFIWEHSPGRCKFTAASLPVAPVIAPHGASPKPQASSFVPERATTRAVDPVKPSLAALFRHPSLEEICLAHMPAAADSTPHAPISSAIPQILPPPAADQPRSSSARYSVIHRNMPPPGTPFNNAPSQIDNYEDDDSVSEEPFSDAVTATAGEGLSIDDSLVPSGTLRPASTPSEARDFIMHRFLPAAHTIACELPQTPSRRFQPLAGVGGLMPCSPSMAGSFRDVTAACRPSPLRYVSASSTPVWNPRQVPPRGSQLHAGSFHGEAEQEEEEEEEEEDEEEEPPFTPKSCGIFPFRITISFHNRHSTGQCFRRSNPSSKYQHNKQQQQKKGCKSINCVGSPMRIMDILQDDQSSSHDDESPAHRLRGKHSEAEKERIKVVALDQAGLMPASNDRRPKLPPNSYYRESPNLQQLLTAQHAGSELSYNEVESSEYGSYQDAPSRFQSPSPAAFQLNARALRAHNPQSPLVNTVAQRSISFAGIQDDQTSPAIINTTEQHLLNSSFYYYNMHSSMNKPHMYQSQHLPSSSHCHTPVSSHVGAPHQNCGHHHNLSDNSDNSNTEKSNYHYIETMNADQQWDAASPHLPEETHIINNALFEHEDQETNMITKTKWSALNQARHGGMHGCIGDHHNCNGDPHVVDHRVINGDLRGCKGDHHLNSANRYLSNGCHYVSYNNSHHANKDNPHVINANHNLKYTGDMAVSTHGDVSTNIMNSSLPTKSCLLAPPLPKSPTHSWLDRAMPLVTSTFNKRLSTSSRFSHMHKAVTPADDHAAPVSMNKTRKQGSTEASKWEALVKGSHRQPGHLRFSEELLHQSQSVTKIGAS